MGQVQLGLVAAPGAQQGLAEAELQLQ